MNATARQLAALVALRAWSPNHPEMRGIDLAVEDWFVQDAHEALERIDAAADAEQDAAAGNVVHGVFVRPGVFYPHRLTAYGFLGVLARVLAYDADHNRQLRTGYGLQASVSLA